MTVETAADDGATAAVLAKILAMTFLGVSSFVAGSTPVCLFERLGVRREAGGAAAAALRLMLNFGGGVLLCTTFLHLLPEVREGVEQLTDDGTLDKESRVTEMLAELIMCAGFFFMYAVEELVHGFADGRHGCHAHDDQPHRHHQHHHHQHYHHRHHDRHRGHGPRTKELQRDDADGGRTNSGFEKDREQVAAVTAGRVTNYNSCTSDVEMNAADPKAPPQSSVLRGFLIVGALSIHELFEGLAVGLEKNPAQVWSLAVAVACHKIVIAVYVGLQMLSDRTRPLLAHCSILLFAVTSPMGIGAGALVSHLEATHDVAVLSVALQGLATGTLMYVVFFEVLKPSAGHQSIKQRALRLASIAVGFATMLSVQLLISE